MSCTFQNCVVVDSQILYTCVEKTSFLESSHRNGSEAVPRKIWEAILTCSLKMHLSQKPDFGAENFEGSATYFRERPVQPRVCKFVYDRAH